MELPEWTSPEKPAELAESRLIDAILEGRFPIGTNLPAERELAGLLGVTRPTLREALQRLRRDGWIEVRHGRPTRVCDYWTEGSLGVLSAIASRLQHLPPNFVSNLLAVRELMAPAYTRLAVEHQPEQVAGLLSVATSLENNPAAYAQFDWNLHHTLAVASGNPVFTLILNGFHALYLAMGCLYFQPERARLSSQRFYRELLAAVRAGDGARAEGITRAVMDESLSLWQALSQAVQES